MPKSYGVEKSSGFGNYCPKCDDRCWALAPPSRKRNILLVPHLLFCTKCGIIFGEDQHDLNEDACALYSVEPKDDINKARKLVAAMACPASVPRHVVTSFDNLLVAPDEKEFSYRNRIVLESSDGIKFYTHATIMCCSSELLRAFYHGKYDASEAGAEKNARVIDGSEYRSFKLKEANQVTLDLMLRFVYLEEVPSASAELGPLIQVCDYLQIDSFKPHVVEIVNKAIEQKTLNKDEWKELMLYLVQFRWDEAFEAIVGVENVAKQSQPEEPQKKKKKKNK